MPSTNSNNTNNDNNSSSPEAAAAAATEQATQARIQKKRDKILLELSATVNTLASIGQVLDDIIELTDHEEPPAAAAAAAGQHHNNNRDDHKKKEENVRNILHKQLLLLNELNEWKSVIGRNTLQRSSAFAGGSS